MDAPALSFNGQSSPPHRGFSILSLHRLCRAFLFYLILNYVDLSSLTDSVEYFLSSHFTDFVEYLFSLFQSPTMSTTPSVDTNVQIDADGFNTMIKWTCVGRGGKKSDSLCRRNEADTYSGMSDMRKKEERVHEPCLSDRSHVMLSDMSNSRAYQKMI